MTARIPTLIMYSIDCYLPQWMGFYFGIFHVLGTYRQVVYVTMVIELR